MNLTYTRAKQWLQENLLRGVLLLFILLGCGLRVYHLSQQNPADNLWSDPARHWNNAIGAVDTSPLPLINPVGFQVWLGVVAKLTLGNRLLVGLYAAFMSLAMPWFWYRFLREIFDSKNLALVGWAILANLPSWVGIYGLFMTETLFLFLLGFALWMTGRSLRTKTTNAFLLMAVSWTVLGLVRGIAGPMAVPAAAYVWFTQKQKLPKAVGAVALIGIILFCTGYRTYHQTGIFAPLGIGNYDRIYCISGKKIINLYFVKEGLSYTYWFGSPSVGQQPFAPFSDRKTNRSGTFDLHIDLDNQKESYDAGLQAAKAIAPSWWGWPMREQLLFLLLGESWPDNDQQYLMNRLAIHMRWLWPPLFVLAIGVSGFCLRKHFHQVFIPFSVVIVWFLVQGLFPLVVNEGRYRKPAEGLMIICLLVPFDKRKGLGGG